MTESVDITKNPVIPSKEECDQSLEVIRKVVRDTWQEFDNIDNIDLYPYPSHDHNHCSSTENVLRDIFHDEQVSSLDDLEMFLLKAAIWLHDIGMQPKILSEDTGKNFSDPGEAENIFQKVRKEHAQRSVKYIEENITKLKLEKLAPEYIELLKAICKVHGHRAHQELYQLKWIQHRVRTQLLVAYLRLADALHIPPEPDPSAFKKFLSLGIDTVSRFHWLKSKYALEVTCDPINFTIIIFLRRPKDIEADQMQPIVELVCKTLQDELDSIKEILSKGGVVFYSEVKGYSEIVTNMNLADVSELQELLANLQLYDTTMTPSARAVIDNVFQQILMFIGKDGYRVPPDQAVEYMDEYCKNALTDILDKRPCYVFLRKVSGMLETILGSDMEDDEKPNW